MFHRAFAMLMILAEGAMAQDSPVPACDELDADIAGLADCALVADPLVIAFLYQPAGEGAVLTVTQTDAVDGATQVSAPLGVKGTGSAPEFHDLDGDGTEELWVPLAHDGVETAYVVWRMGPIGFYDPVSEVTVTAPSDFDSSGDLIRYVGPEADGRSIESAFLFDDGGLTQVFAIERDRDAGTCTMMTSQSPFNAAILLADCEARLGQTEETSQ